jgi:hypothetical protein
LTRESPPAGTNCGYSGTTFLRLASKTGGSEGLVVRVSPPEKARYPAGAPVVVHMWPDGGVGGSVACLSEHGFIDVAFLCPGGDYRAADGTVWRSGGAGDSHRLRLNPLDCVEPLADVLAFATGRTRSLDGKPIHGYVGKVKVATADAGILGLSYGGNIAVLAMARYGERFPGLKWFASWESPMLSRLDGGWGSSYQANAFFDAATGKIDFERLRYSPEMPLRVWPLLFLRPLPDWPSGGLYLDGDRDGRFNSSADYAFWVDVEPGPPVRVYYTPPVTREAFDRRVFGDKWPPHIATREEVEERQSRIDALRHIPAAVKKLPQLAILVYQSQTGHVSIGYENALAHVNAWMDVHARWARFNPDVHYIEWSMRKKPSREIQFPAGRKISRQTIRDLVEPQPKDGGPTHEQGMTAAVCELADRTFRKNWAPMLTRLLIQEGTRGASAR